MCVCIYIVLPVTGAGSTTVNKWVNLVCTVGHECKTAEGHKDGKRSGCKNPIKQCDHGSELNKCWVDPDLGTPEKIVNKQLSKNVNKGNAQWARKFKKSPDQKNSLSQINQFHEKKFWCFFFFHEFFCLDFF